MRLSNIANVIGYDLEKAIELIGEGFTVSVETTQTPYEDKRIERAGKKPVVVRQIVEDGKIKLTTSCFK